MKISVKSIHFSADAKLIAYIEQKLSRLSTLFENITHAEVHLKLGDNSSKIKEKITEVHLHIPGGWIVDKKTGRTFEASINNSTETLKRQIVKHKEKTGIRHIEINP
jgi:putative sigma-54 modulation protein